MFEVFESGLGPRQAARELADTRVLFLLSLAGVRGRRESLAAAAAGPPPLSNTKEYSRTYLAMGFANVRAGTRVLMLVLVQARSHVAEEAVAGSQQRGGRAGLRERAPTCGNPGMK